MVGKYPTMVNCRGGRDGLYGFCRIGRGSSVKQAIRQKTTDELEPSQRPSALASTDMRAK